MKKNPLKHSRYKDITFSWGNAWAIGYCILREYLDLCSWCLSCSGSLLSVSDVVCFFSFESLLLCHIRDWKHHANIKFHSHLLKRVTPFHPRKSFPVSARVSYSGKEAALLEEAGIKPRVGASLEQQASESVLQASGFQSLHMVMHFCSSCPENSLASPSIPKPSVYHSLQKLLHVHQNKLHLCGPAVNPGTGFNTTLKPQELKYKFVLFLKTQYWTYLFLALTLYGCSYTAYLQVLKSLVGPLRNGDKQSNVLSLQTTFTLNLSSPNAPNW